MSDKGHNRQPLITPDQLRADFAHLDREALKFESRLKDIPDVIQDDDQQGRLQDMVKEIDGLGKRSETTRVDTKAPFLEGERTIDSYFHGIRDRLVATRKSLTLRGDDYLNRKDAAEKAAREAEARKLHEKAEAERKEAAEREAEAKRLREANQLQQAQQVEAQAVASARVAQSTQAQAAVVAAPAPTPITRGEKSSASLRKSWIFQVDDIDKVPAAELWAYIPRATIEVAIRAYMLKNAPADLKDGEVWKPLPGVTFLQTTSGTYR